MTSRPLQRLQRSAKAVRQVLAHSDASDHVGFSRPVSVLGDGGEGDANNPLLMEKLCEEIDVERLYSVIEDNDPVAVMADLTDCAGHATSLRETWFHMNFSEVEA